MPLILQVTIQPPVPPQIKRSYTGSGYGNYGFVGWVYEGFYTQQTWVNFMKQECIAPRENPDAYYFYFKPGVIAICHVELKLGPAGTPEPVNVAGKEVNPATGEGLPLAIP